MEILILLLCCKLVLTAEVIYYNESYERSFHEPSLHSMSIAVKFNDNLLSSIPNYAGWLVEEYSNNTGTTAVLVNRNVGKTTPKEFKITVSFSTKALEIYNYVILDASLTDDVTLFSDPEQRLLSMFWLFDEKPESSVALTSSETEDNKIVITENHNSIFLTVSHRSRSKKSKEPFQPLAAHSGIYSCHMLVAGNDNIHGVKKVRVFSEVTAFLIPPNGQSLTGQDITLSCLAYGYPLPKLTWSFAQHPEHVFENVDAKNTIISQVFPRERSLTSVSKSTLTVTKAEYGTNRGYYICTASNELGSTEASHYLRIRYRYGILVPLTGIVLEIGVLYCIIVLSNRKRDRQNFVKQE